MATIDTVWRASDTTPGDIEAALRRELADIHRENASYVPARVLNLICVVDKQGTILFNVVFDNNAQGWADIAARLAPYPNLAVTIETSCGPAVDAWRRHSPTPKPASRARSLARCDGVARRDADVLRASSTVRTSICPSVAAPKDACAISSSSASAAPRIIRNSGAIRGCACGMRRFTSIKKLAIDGSS